MSMPLTASADDQDDETDGPRVADPAVRSLIQSQQWTISSNWDGNNYVGPGLPPWGTRPRCPVTRNGRRCRKSVIPGGTVCNTHGGAAPQVKRRAQLRLLSLVDPAVSTLARILTTSTDEKLKAQVAQDILNRTGMGKQNEVSADVAKAVMMDRYFAMRDAAALAREEAGLPPIGRELEMPAEVDIPEAADGEQEELESLPESHEMAELVDPDNQGRTFADTLDELDYSDSYAADDSGQTIIVTSTSAPSSDAGGGIVSSNVARAREAAALRTPERS